FLDFRQLGIVVDQRQQTQHAGARAYRPPRAQQLRTREVIALEVMHAELAALLEIRLRLHLLRHQLGAAGAQRFTYARQIVPRYATQIDLDHADQGQQGFDARVIAGVVVQRQFEAAFAQFTATVDKRVVHHGGLQDLQHDLLRRKQVRQLAGEKAAVDVEKTAQPSEHLLDAEFVQYIAH